MAEVLKVRCCVAGGGPAGMMLGLLLARAGVDVLVLEKHADFLRDFRGDTVHPSTLQVIHELGLLEKFLARPHDEVSEMRAMIGNTELVLASFKRLRIRCQFIAMMPQWEFLDFVRDEAEELPLRHHRDELAAYAQALEIGEHQFRVAHHRAHFADLSSSARAPRFASMIQNASRRRSQSISPRLRRSRSVVAFNF